MINEQGIGAEAKTNTDLNLVDQVQLNNINDFGTQNRYRFASRFPIQKQGPDKRKFTVEFRARGP